MGWFLGHLAVASNWQEQAHRSLAGVKVRDVMHTRFDTVPATLPLTTFIADFLMRSSQTLWPVVSDGQVVGTIAMPQVVSHDDAARGRLTVGDVMQALDSANTVQADLDGESLLQQLHDPALVFDQGKVVGIAQARDVLQWLAIRTPALPAQ